MDNLHLSEVLEGDDDLSDHVLRQNVVEAALSPQEVQEAAPGAELDEQVKLVVVLEGLVEFYNRWMVETGQDAPLNEHFFDSPLVDKPVQKHLLKGVVCWDTFAPWIKLLLHRSVLELHLEDCAIGTVTDLRSGREVVSGERFRLGDARAFTRWRLRLSLDSVLCLLGTSLQSRRGVGDLQLLDLAQGLSPALTSEL